MAAILAKSDFCRKEYDNQGGYKWTVCGCETLGDWEAGEGDCERIGRHVGLENLNEAQKSGAGPSGRRTLGDFVRPPEREEQRCTLRRQIPLLALQTPAQSKHEARAACTKQQAPKLNKAKRVPARSWGKCPLDVPFWVIWDVPLRRRNT